MCRLKMILLALVLSFGSAAAQAEIFRYLDETGRTLFTDQEISNPKFRLVWRSGSGVQQPSSRMVAYGGTFQTASSYRPTSKKAHANRQIYSPMIEKVARDARLSVDLLHAVIKAESAYDPRARSHAGAMGLMQLMPGTAERYGVGNAWDPAQNLAGGARYLRDLLDMFENNLRLALAAYNAGEGAVKKYGNRIPPYPETRDYVQKVVEFYLDERKQGRS